MKQKDIRKITETRLKEVFDLLCKAEKNMVKARLSLTEIGLVAITNFDYKVERGEDPSVETWLLHTLAADITRCEDILRLIDAIFNESDVFNPVDDDDEDEDE